MKRALITDLHRIASHRRDGYLQACQRLGKLSPDGQWLWFTNEAHAELRQQYNPAPPPKPGRGLGDAIHRVAGPIGRAINWPCLKGDGSTDLKPNSPCDKLRRAANKITTG